MTKSHPSPSKNPVSILTCTNRPECMKTIFKNFKRQNYKHKELIIILNHSKKKLKPYLAAEKKYKNVRVYRMPSHVSLGKCLNYGVKLSKYNYIAKFDDDDYYAKNYLTDSMQTMKRTKADIVGKRAHYMYLKGKKNLILRYSKMENQRVSRVQGATLLVKRHVFNKITFPNQSLGECVKFCAKCLARGYKIYSGSKSNFIAIRRKNSKNHTWIVSDKFLLSRSAKMLKVKNIRKLKFPLK